MFILGRGWGKLYSQSGLFGEEENLSFPQGINQNSAQSLVAIPTRLGRPLQ
jgi:hypothetical protein